VSGSTDAWTLLWTQRANSGNNLEQCSSGLQQYLNNPCGSADAVAGAAHRETSYSLGRAQWPASTTQLLVQQYAGNVLQAESYVLNYPTGAVPLPDDGAVHHTPMTSVCNSAGVCCDATNVFLKSTLDQHYDGGRCVLHQAICFQSAANKTNGL
jgi:hypothetical protein